MLAALGLGVDGQHVFQAQDHLVEGVHQIPDFLMAAGLDLDVQIVVFQLAHPLDHRLDRHHNGVEEVQGEHTEQTQQQGHHQKQQSAHHMEPLGQQPFLHKGDHRPPGVGDGAGAEQKPGGAAVGAQRRPQALAAGGELPGVLREEVPQGVAAEVAVKDLARLVQQNGGAQLAAAPGPADDVAGLGGGEKGHQVNLIAFVHRAVQGHGGDQDKDVVLLDGIGQPDPAGVVAADAHLIGRGLGRRIPGGGADLAGGEHDLFVHVDAAAVPHIEHPAQNVLRRGHGGVKGPFQLLAGGIILHRPGRVVHLGGHGGELPVVDVHKVGQLQRGCPHVGLKDRGDALLEGVDGLDGGGPDQVADNAESSDEHHQKRNHHQNDEAAEIKLFEHRQLFCARHKISPKGSGSCFAVYYKGLQTFSQGALWGHFFAAFASEKGSQKDTLGETQKRW